LLPTRKKTSLFCRIAVVFVLFPIRILSDDGDPTHPSATRNTTSRPYGLLDARESFQADISSESLRKVVNVRWEEELIIVRSTPIIKNHFILFISIIILIFSLIHTSWPHLYTFLFLFFTLLLCCVSSSYFLRTINQDFKIKMEHILVNAHLFYNECLHIREILLYQYYIVSYYVPPLHSSTYI
jgi:hypothetical protein